MQRRRDRELARKIGEAIATGRREVGWTQERLAEELSISVVHAGLLERGQRLPSLSTLIGVAGVLGLSLDELFLGDRRQARAEGEEVARLLQATPTELRSMAIAFLRAGVAAVSTGRDRSPRRPSR
jgi:transcriptional regulator with XRE-family HTH domain